jgi:thioester reductase-like protein
MEEMVLKYSQEFPEHRPAVQVPHEQAVLVTGTTGALGSHILAHLLALPEISVVYAFNRVGSSIQERQRFSFVNNGIDAELLTSPKLRLLEGNLTKHAFGLAADDFSEIKTRVTCIIHNGEQLALDALLCDL